MWTTLNVESEKFLKLFWNQNSILGWVCFLKLFDFLTPDGDIAVLNSILHKDRHTDRHTDTQHLQVYTFPLVHCGMLILRYFYRADK